MLPQKDVFLNLVAFGYYLLGISWFKMILSAISFIKYVLKSTQGMLVTPSHSLNRSLRKPTMALSTKSYKETLSMVFDFEVHLRVRLCLHIASSKLGVVLEIFLLKEL